MTKKKKFVFIFCDLFNRERESVAQALSMALSAASTSRFNVLVYLMKDAVQMALKENLPTSGSMLAALVRKGARVCCENSPEGHIDGVQEMPPEALLEELDGAQVISI